MSEDGDRVYTPHKAVRRIGDHVIDHLAEVEALLAGVETIPDGWHASLATFESDWARFTEQDLVEAQQRLRRLGMTFALRIADGRAPRVGPAPDTELDAAGDLRTPHRRGLVRRAGGSAATMSRCGSSTSPRRPTGRGHRTGAYTTSTRGGTLAEEGFIHASRADQWEGVAYYADVTEPLLLLEIDTDLLDVPVMEEPPAPGARRRSPTSTGRSTRPPSSASRRCDRRGLVIPNQLTSVG